MPSAGAWPGQSNTVTADPTRNSTPAMLPIHAVKARVGLTVRVREVSGRGRATAAMIAARSNTSATITGSRPAGSPAERRARRR